MCTHWIKQCTECHRCESCLTQLIFSPEKIGYSCLVLPCYVAAQAERGGGREGGRREGGGEGGGMEE